MASAYPARGRTAWILAQRPPRPAAPDPNAPHGVFLERERLASGAVADSGVVLLTNRECPWRCLMCDLWKDTTRRSVPEGAIPRQVEFAVRKWSDSGTLPVQVKLYNSGSFFDPAAIPPADYAPVARRLAFARHVVVESHPLLVGERARVLRDLLSGSLEVALGLETAHPEVLAKLNKKFDLAQFARAAEFLAAGRIALRAFILVHPPFMNETEGAEWVVKSAEFAFCVRRWRGDADSDPRRQRRDGAAPRVGRVRSADPRDARGGPAGRARAGPRPGLRGYLGSGAVLRLSPLLRRPARTAGDGEPDAARRASGPLRGLRRILNAERGGARRSRSQ